MAGRYCTNLLNITVIMSHDLWKYIFTNRVIPLWNSSSDYVVSAETANTMVVRYIIL